MGRDDIDVDREFLLRAADATDSDGLRHALTVAAMATPREREALLRDAQSEQARRRESHGPS